MAESLVSETGLTALPARVTARPTRRRASAPPTGGRRAKSPYASLDGVRPGRAVQRTTDRWQFTSLDTQRRPHGREEHTISALRALRDFAPEASQAVWNYLRMVNPGHDLKTFQFDGEGSETKEEGPAQAYLDDLVRRVGTEYGQIGLEQLHNVLALNLITIGAVCAEVAPTEDLADTEDWYPVDPTLIAFRRDERDRLVMGQRYRDGSFKELNPNQVFYIPLDPDVDDPYGRPPLLPALSATLAKGQMLNDLRAVAHNQGYPRLDVTIKWDAIMQAAPPQLREPGREGDFKDWTEGVLGQIVTDYESLQVDDTFVHYDWVKIDMVGGAAGVGAFDFKSLEAILTRQLNSALKTLPILMGVNETTSETHGSIQWQIQAKGVEALQRIIKRIIEKLANTSLQIKGLSAHAKLEYEEIRTVDRLFEAQADFFVTRTVQLQEMMGWRSHDEAAEMITKHAAMGPILDTKTPAPNLSTNAGGDTSQGPSKADTPSAAEIGGKAKQATKAAGDWAAWKEVFEAIDDIREVRLPHTVVRKTKPQIQALTAATLDALCETYEAKAREIYAAAMSDCVQQMQAEGWTFARSYMAVDDDWTGAESRDLARDIADYVFGIGYSRSMKALLREAFEEGIARSGVDVDALGVQIDDRLIENVWKTNRQFVLKLRAELKAALASGEFSSFGDVTTWFKSREWRETLMGRFLAKQGIAAGYAYALSLENAAITFTWVTVGSGESCAECLSRSGHSFTYEELMSRGFPGAIELDCGANCRCHLEPE